MPEAPKCDDCRQFPAKDFYKVESVEETVPFASCGKCVNRKRREEQRGPWKWTLITMGEFLIMEVLWR